MFEYFLQTDKTQGIRRYRPGAQDGQRWDRLKRVWSDDCASRRACELTRDRVITEQEFLEQI